jgi:hypothetical protein
LNNDIFFIIYVIVALIMGLLIGFIALYLLCAGAFIIAIYMVKKSLNIGFDPIYQCFYKFYKKSNTANDCENNRWTFKYFKYILYVNLVVWDIFCRHVQKLICFCKISKNQTNYQCENRPQKYTNNFIPQHTIFLKVNSSS